MSRQEAIVRVVARGGVVCTKVSRRTDVIVIGSDGWPLQKSGKLTRHLEAADDLERLGFPIDVISEQEFFKRLRPNQLSRSVRRTHTLEQLSRLLGVSGLRLRRWLDRGLIEPVERRDGIALFDFQQVNAARTVAKVVQQGVSVKSLIANLHRLKRWLPDDTLISKHLLQLKNELLVRDAAGQLIEPSGQMRLPLEDDSPNETLLELKQLEEFDPDALFDLAFASESEGKYGDAIDTYERWITLFGDDIEALFNLGNTYLAVEQYESAEACYRRCLHLDRMHGTAWNNRGLCLAELGRVDEAIHCLETANRLMPGCRDTKANLVSVLEDAKSS